MIKGRKIAGKPRKTKKATTSKPKTTAPKGESMAEQYGPALPTKAQNEQIRSNIQQNRAQRKLAESKARQANKAPSPKATAFPAGKVAATLQGFANREKFGPALPGGNVANSKGGGEKGTGTGLKKTGGGFRGAKGSEFSQRQKGAQMRNNLRAMYQSTNNAGRRARMEKVAQKYGFSLNTKVNQAKV